MSNVDATPGTKTVVMAELTNLVDVAILWGSEPGKHEYHKTDKCIRDCLPEFQATIELAGWWGPAGDGSWLLWGVDPNARADWVPMGYSVPAAAIAEESDDG